MRKKDSSDSAENIKVIVRSRPLNSKEKEAGYNSCVTLDLANSTVAVNHVMGEPDRWTFDGVVNNTLSQKDVFVQYITPMIDSVMNGFNATVFCYGQSGSGKSFTMTGALHDPDLNGVIPRTFTYVFDTARREQETNPGRKYSMSCEFLELYNNKTRDLLSPKQETLDVKENKDKSFFVKGALRPSCRTPQDLLDRVDEGTARRQVAATELNADSSRSHSIFTLHLEMIETTEDGDVRSVTSKLNLVDLAGSERQGKTGATGDTLKEGCNINLSLSNLGTVIDCLVKAKPHIPFRSNPLTMLLKDSLGGNSKTCMFANINPSEHNISETISTLRFADRAKQIKNKPVIQLDTKDQKIKELTEQLAELKDKLKMFEGAGVKALEDELEQTKEKLGDAEVALENAEKSKETDRMEFLERLQTAESERDELTKNAKEIQLSIDALQGEKEILEQRLGSESKRRIDWKKMLSIEVVTNDNADHNDDDDGTSIEKILDSIRHMKNSFIDPKVHESKLGDAETRRKTAESEVDELNAALDKMKKELSEMTFNFDQATKKQGRLQEKLDREKEGRRAAGDENQMSNMNNINNQSPSRGKSFRRHSTLHDLHSGSPSANNASDLLSSGTVDVEKKWKTDLESKENIIQKLQEQIAGGTELATMTEELVRIQNNGDEMKKKMQEQIDSLTASLAEPKGNDSEREKLIKKALLAKDAALTAALSQTDELEKRLVKLLELRRDVAVGDIREVEGDVIRHQSEIRSTILTDLGNVSNQRNQLLLLSSASLDHEDIKNQIKQIVEENEKLRKKSGEVSDNNNNNVDSLKAEARALRGALVDQKRAAEETVKLVEKQSLEVHEKISAMQQQVENAQNEALEKFLQQHKRKKKMEGEEENGEAEEDEEDEDDPLRSALTVLQREKSLLNSELNVMNRELQQVRVELALKAANGTDGLFSSASAGILGGGSSLEHSFNGDDISYEALKTECLRLRSLLHKGGVSPQKSNTNSNVFASLSPNSTHHNKKSNKIGDNAEEAFQDDLQSSFLEIEQSIAKEVADANEEAKDLRDQMETAKAELEEANDRRDAAVKERDSAQEETVELKNKVRSLQQTLDNTKTRVANLEEESEKQKKSLEAQFSQQIVSLESRLRERGDSLSEQKKLLESQTAVAHSLKEKTDMLQVQLAKQKKEFSDKEKRLADQLEQQEISFQKLLTRRLEEQKEQHQKALVRKDEDLHDLKKKMKKLEDKFDKLRGQYDAQMCEYEELAAAMEEQKLAQMQSMFQGNEKNGGRNSRNAQELRQAEASRKGVDDAIRTAREERQRRNDAFSGTNNNNNNNSSASSSSNSQPPPPPAGSAATLAKIRREVGGTGVIGNNNSMPEGYQTARVGGSSALNSRVIPNSDSYRGGGSGYTGFVAPINNNNNNNTNLAPLYGNTSSLAPLPLAPIPPSQSGRPNGAAPIRGFPGLGAQQNNNNNNNGQGQEDDMYYF